MKKTRITLLTAGLMVLTAVTAFGQDSMKQGNDMWVRLGLSKPSAIEIKKMSADRFRVNMSQIKMILEKSGVTEKVTVLFVGEDGKEIAGLGTYMPDKTSSPGFNSIPGYVEIQVKGPIGSKGDIMIESGTFPSKLPLAFKDSTGKIRATLQAPVKEII